MRLRWAVTAAAFICALDSALAGTWEGVCPECRAVAERVLRLPGVMPGGKIAPPMSASELAALGLPPRRDLKTHTTLQIFSTGTKRIGYCGVEHPEHTWTSFSVRREEASGNRFVSCEEMERTAHAFLAAAVPSEVQPLMVLREAEARWADRQLRLSFDATRVVNGVHVWLPFYVGIEISMDNGGICYARRSQWSPQLLPQESPSAELIAEAIRAGAAAAHLPAESITPVRDVHWRQDARGSQGWLDVLPSESWARKHRVLTGARVRFDGRRVVEVKTLPIPEPYNAREFDFYRAMVFEAVRSQRAPSVRRAVWEAEKERIRQAWSEFYGCLQ